MQYVGKVGDYVYNQWNSLNPATLSGAIDIIVIEQPDGSLHCSPWHVRFGKFQIFKPLEKKIDLFVNDRKTSLPMKLGEGGEAFFVFETDQNDVSLSVVTSPIVSASSSPAASPQFSPRSSVSDPRDMEDLDLNVSSSGDQSSPVDSTVDADEIESKIKLDDSLRPASPRSSISRSDTPTSLTRQAFEKARKITQELNIPSKIADNGDLVLDMDGYKPNSQKNIISSDELMQKVFLKEMENLLQGKDIPVSSGDNEDDEFSLLSSVIIKDENGNIRVVNRDPDYGPAGAELLSSAQTLEADDYRASSQAANSTINSAGVAMKNDKTYIKTLRLTSEQLAGMNLNYGRNHLKFKLSLGTSQVELDLYLWKSTTPIVISDIDGTITKSDALGHVMTMFGKDWTHPGVAKLFRDVIVNGYNILYLTARSVGQADTTRQYLDSINQDGVKLPKGPVILSPDRTMAALKREIILKKPEVFKMACLRDIKSLFFDDRDDERTPFYGGFGNRITDAISYRSVQIPSHRIFTINPDGEVHMELLELAGYKSSYLHINELVDQFFPPLKNIASFNNYWDQNQLDEYINLKIGDSDANSTQARSPVTPGSPASFTNQTEVYRAEEKFTDLNFWREPMANLSDLSDLESDGGETFSSNKSITSSPKSKPSSMPGSPRLGAGNFTKAEYLPSLPPLKKDRPLSASFTSPLKSFMARGNNTTEPKAMSPKMEPAPLVEEDEDYSDDYDDDYDDDYTDDDEDEDGGDDEDDDEDDDEVNDEDEVDEDDFDEADHEVDDGFDETRQIDANKYEADKFLRGASRAVRESNTDAASEFEDDEDRDMESEPSLGPGFQRQSPHPRLREADLGIMRASDLLRNMKLSQ